MTPNKDSDSDDMTSEDGMASEDDMTSEDGMGDERDDAVESAVENFTKLGLTTYIANKLCKIMKLTDTTSVQKQAIPVLLQGRDTMVSSPTGTGKTLVYLIPVLQSLSQREPKLQRKDGIHAVIILPTRELAMQVARMAETIFKMSNWLVVGCVCGGYKRRAEKVRLQKGLTVLIGTPSRLLDHAQNTKAARLDKVSWLILDEADCLLQLGYERTVGSLVAIMDEQRAAAGQQERRQTVMLSATLSPSVRRLAGLVLNDPAYVGMDSSESSSFVIPSRLRQFYVVWPAKMRFMWLLGLLDRLHEAVKPKKIVVFAATRNMVEFFYAVTCTDVYKEHYSSTIKFFRLNADMKQEERQKAFSDFEKTDGAVLLSSDVGSRGLQFSNVAWIVQYNTPTEVRHYVHRVGRTARVGEAGSALLILDRHELEYIELLKSHDINIEESTLVGPFDDARKFGVRPKLENAVKKDRNLYCLACNAYASWRFFYAGYPVKMKKYFDSRAVHLGHYVASFCLTDSPTTVSRVSKENAGKKQTPEATVARRMEHSKKKPSTKRGASSMCEYSSGLYFQKKKQKR